MSYYETPEALRANPPESWRVVRRQIGSSVRWTLYIEAGPVHCAAFNTRREATEERDNPNSPTRRAVEQERQWYAGITPSGWRTYAECREETARIERAAALKAKAGATIVEWL